VNLVNETFINITSKVKGDNLKARYMRGSFFLACGILNSIILGVLLFLTSCILGFSDTNEHIILFKF
jgi:hypothetical protein